MIRKRVFSTFIKSNNHPSKPQIEKIKQRLFNSKWVIKDDIVSTFPAKQLYITTQSLLDKDCPPFMESLLVNSTGKNINDIFKLGDKVPIGYSLAYCNPLSNEYELSTDGYDNYHAPVLDCNEYFQRRMWVSGLFLFNNSNPLKFGEPINFTETVDKVKILTRNEMILADYKRSFDNDKGNSIIEHRLLCYLNNVFKKLLEEPIIDETVPDESTSCKPSIVSSFRMSAITFNSHQIHYNPEYAKNIENYPKVVIEAPLLISLALQFWRNHNPTTPITSFKYKITSPTFVNDTIKINVKKMSSGKFRVWILKEDSSVCFESTIKI